MKLYVITSNISLFFVWIISHQRLIRVCAVAAAAAVLPLEGGKELTITIYRCNRRPSPYKLQDLLQEYMAFFPPLDDSLQCSTAGNPPLSLLHTSFSFK